jgi:hypothetical protein
LELLEVAFRSFFKLILSVALAITASAQAARLNSGSAENCRQLLFDAHAVIQTEPEQAARFVTDLVKKDKVRKFALNPEADVAVASLFEEIKDLETAAIPYSIVRALFEDLLETRRDRSLIASQTDPLEFTERTIRIAETAVSYARSIEHSALAEYAQTTVEPLQALLKTQNWFSQKHVRSISLPQGTLQSHYPSATISTILFFDPRAISLDHIGRGGFNTVFEASKRIGHNSDFFFEDQPSIHPVLRKKDLRRYVFKYSSKHDPIFLARELELYEGIESELEDDRLRFTPKYDGIELADSYFTIANIGEGLLTIQEKSEDQSLLSFASEHQDELLRLAGPVAAPLKTDAKIRHQFRYVFQYAQEKIRDRELREVMNLMTKLKKLDDSDAITRANKTYAKIKRPENDYFISALTWGKLVDQNHIRAAVKNIDAGFGNIKVIKDPKTGHFRLKLIDY